MKSIGNPYLQLDQLFFGALAIDGRPIVNSLDLGYRTLAAIMEFRFISTLPGTLKLEMPCSIAQRALERRSHRLSGSMGRT